jgi:hypothetical protein
MSADLATTNLMLGIMAAVSLLEAVAIAGLGIAGFSIYRRMSAMLDTLDERHLTPTMVRVNAILDDVKVVTATVKDETARVDHAIANTMDRIDDAAVRVRTNVRAKASRMVGLVRGIRAVIEGLLAASG